MTCWASSDGTKPTRSIFAGLPWSLQAKKNSCTRQTNPSVKKLLIIFGYSLILKARRWCKRFGFMPQQNVVDREAAESVGQEDRRRKTLVVYRCPDLAPRPYNSRKDRVWPRRLLEGRENPT